MSNSLRASGQPRSGFQDLLNSGLGSWNSHLIPADIQTLSLWSGVISKSGSSSQNSIFIMSFLELKIAPHCRDSHMQTLKVGIWGAPSLSLTGPYWLSSPADSFSFSTRVHRHITVYPARLCSLSFLPSTSVPVSMLSFLIVPARASRLPKDPSQTKPTSGKLSVLRTPGTCLPTSILSPLFQLSRW